MKKYLIVLSISLVAFLVFIIFSLEKNNETVVEISGEHTNLATAEYSKRSINKEDRNQNHLSRKTSDYLKRIIDKRTSNLKEYSAKQSKKERVDEVYFDEAPIILDDILTSEVEDSEWTHQMETFFNSINQREKLVSMVHDKSDCRRTLCKSTFFVPNEEVLDEFKKNWMSEGTFGNDFGKVETLENGDTKITLWFSHSKDPSPFIEVREEISEAISGS